MIWKIEIRSCMCDGDTLFLPTLSFYKRTCLVPLLIRVDCGCQVDKCNMVSRLVHFELLGRNSQEVAPFKKNAGALMPCQRLHFLRNRGFMAHPGRRISCHHQKKKKTKQNPLYRITKAVHTWYQMEHLFSSSIFNHKLNQAYNLF